MTAIALLLVGLFTLGQQKEVPKSLLLDGGFEGGSVSLASYWFTAVPGMGGSEVGLDTVVSFEGTSCAFLRNNEPRLGVPLLLGQKLSGSDFSKWVGRECTFSGAIKLKSALLADIRLDALDSRGKAIDQLSLTRGGVSGNMEWKRFEAKLVIPAGSSALVVNCTLQGTGTAWFDDIRLSPSAGDEGKKGAPQVEEFREKLSQYVRAPEGSSEKELRKALDAYRDLPLTAIENALADGLVYEKKSPGSMKEESLRAGETWRYQVFLPKDYTPEQAWPAVIQLAPAPSADLGDPFPQTAQDNRLILVKLDLYQKLQSRLATPAASDEAANQAPPTVTIEPKHVQIVLECLRDLRRKYHVNPDRVGLLGQSGACELAAKTALSLRGEIAALALLQTQYIPDSRYARSASGLPVYLTVSSEGEISYETVVQSWKSLGAKPDLKDEASSSEALAAQSGEVLNWLRDFSRDSQAPDQFQEAFPSNMDTGSFWIEVMDFDSRPLKEGAMGRIHAELKQGTEAVIEAQGMRRLRLLCPFGLFNLDSPIRVLVNGQNKFEGNLTPDFDLFLKQIRRTGDYKRLIIASKEIRI